MDLDRFVTAQKDTYAAALSELRTACHFTLRFLSGIKGSR
jgi:uncharacterized protein (DUF1810 family)